MKRFIVLTFLFLGWGFYELSGGAEFTPEVRGEQIADAVPTAANSEPEVLVTRASTMTSNTSLTTTLAETNPSEDITTGDAVILQASLSQPSTSEAPVVEAEPEVFQFQSLVEGAPTVADILPETEIAVLTPDVPEPTVAAALSGTLRQVAGNRVNMRSGPGTNFSVLTTLTRGTDVEVLEVNANGWARLRQVSSGQEGWMAERLLTDG